MDDRKAPMKMADLCHKMFETARANEQTYGSRESGVRFSKNSEKYKGYRSYKNTRLNTLDDEELKVYNNRGWAYDLLNDKDMLLLSQKIDEIHQELFAGKSMLGDGTFLVDVNDKALVISGTRQSPIIDLVLLTDTKSFKNNLDVVKDVIYESERFRHSKEKLASYLTFAIPLFKKENLQLFKREDYQYKKSEGEAGQRTEISSSFEYDQYFAIFQDRTGNNTEATQEVSKRIDTDYLSAVERGDIKPRTSHTSASAGRLFLSVLCCC